MSRGKTLNRKFIRGDHWTPRMKKARDAMKVSRALFQRSKKKSLHGSNTHIFELEGGSRIYVPTMRGHFPQHFVQGTSFWIDPYLYLRSAAFERNVLREREGM
jgi:hypothetical protein